MSDCYSCTWDYDYVPGTKDPLVRYIALCKSSLTLDDFLELWVLL